ncbi:hypothetical protein CR513_26990, partial [Mucuna pruriens]
MFAVLLGLNTTTTTGGCCRKLIIIFSIESIFVSIVAFMTRKRSFGSLHPFDPKIEKTLNKIRKSKNMHIAHNSSSVSFIIVTNDFEMNPDFADNPLYESDPMENNNNRTLKELATPDLEPAQTYKLKSGLIHLLPKFHGLVGEDLHKHLKKFHVVYSTIRSQGIPEDYIKMKAFFFSLDGAAKDRECSLRSSSLHPEQRPSKRRFVESDNIQGKHYTSIKKDLISCAPHVRTTKSTNNYCYRLLIMDRSMIDAASGGALMDKTPAVAR